jgi:hypothetical protein
MHGRTDDKAGDNGFTACSSQPYGNSTFCKRGADATYAAPYVGMHTTHHRVVDPGARRAYLPTSNISRLARSSRKSTSRDEQKNLQPCKCRTCTRTCCCKIIVSLWITQLDTTKGEKQASSGSRSARSAITGQQVHDNTKSPTTLHVPRACEK